ncbi:hypothetical protein K466DRAFT_606163 [Polyporus arcularius HHB13444]|uniref:Uncharacterized protein n=1 Tax=Polyporus arcularius HHB13444 TaxID=1314778 RepID=A0A5C3NS82_9APHY|nr:hypothetical protein K466DRAFT_606163 [Polyporus arcularius HHB13444]
MAYVLHKLAVHGPVCDALPVPIAIMYNTEEMNLGNDVRQFVISVYVGDKLKGLEVTITEGQSNAGALYALQR